MCLWYVSVLAFYVIYGNYMLDVGIKSNVDISTLSVCILSTAAISKNYIVLTDCLCIKN